MRKLFALLLTAALALSCALPIMAKAAVQTGDAVILYTNDVHTYINGELSYADAAGLKDYYEAQGNAVLPMDAGDHVQGTTYGSMDKGSHIVQLMNAAEKEADVIIGLGHLGVDLSSGVWTSGPSGQYRVQNVQIRNRETGVYEPLDLAKNYRLAGYNYTPRDLGGGFAMFNDAVNVLDYVLEDYLVLATYIQSFPVDETIGLPMDTVTAAQAQVILLQYAK